jgi:hypothetical protein
MSALLNVALEGEDEECFKLTWTQKLLGFAATALLGLFSGFLALIAIALLRIRRFGILFSFCNCMILASTGFLIGFRRQAQSLCERKRYLASIGMIVGIGLTFFSASRKKPLLGVIVGFLIDFTSFACYALSYLPCGDRIIRRVTGF